MIKVGNRVRSYDFARDRECYVEGIVEGFERLEGCERYKIRVERKVWAGEECGCNNGYVYPPLNGTPRLFGGECNGVELVS